MGAVVETGDLDLTGHRQQVDMEVRQSLLLHPFVLKVTTLVVFVRRRLLQAGWEVFFSFLLLLFYDFFSLW